MMYADCSIAKQFPQSSPTSNSHKMLYSHHFIPFSVFGVSISIICSFVQAQSQMILLTLTSFYLFFRIFTRRFNVRSVSCNSCTVVSLPSVMRIHAYACASLSPTAFSTCDGSASDVLHALPADTQMPASSSSSTRLDACMPGKQIFRLPGSRCVWLPTRNAPGISLQI